MRRREYLTGLVSVGVLGFQGCTELGGTRGDRDTEIQAAESALVDEGLDLAVTELGDDAVRVEARTDDGRGREWVGHAVFEPTEPRIDLSEVAPTDGTYQEAEPMGLFWSMRPADSTVSFYDAPATQTVRLRVRPDEPEADAVAETTIDRHVRHPDSEETRVRDPVVGTLVEPPESGPSPGVILFHGSAGVRPVAQARALASHGFTVLALQYFSSRNRALPDSLVEVPVEYADRAVEWLADHDAVDDSPIGLGGFSRGGELALLVGSRHDTTGTVVNWAGAGLLFGAFDWGGSIPDTSAWSLDGEPLAHPPNDEVPAPLDEASAYETLLENTPTERLREAEIPLDEVNAPILLLSAGGDGLWPSRFLLNRAERRLDDLGYDHRYEHHSYDDAGHGLGVPSLPTWANRPDGPLGGTRAGTAAADRDSWPRAIEFFELGAGR